MTSRIKGISIRWLLLAVSALILLLPVFAILSLRVYQNHLVRQTERSLIAQSVLIGEIWRDKWFEAEGLSSENEPSFRPKGVKEGHFVPIEPKTDLRDGVLPSMEGPSRFVQPSSGPKWIAGKAVLPALKRAKVFNLSSARVLDDNGCAIAATGDWYGGCFDQHVEIERALKGKYASVIRQRISDEPKPSYESISRRGDVRVFIATPIFSDREVVAVVWMSRTSLAPLKAAWLNRWPLIIGLGSSMGLAALVSLFLAWTITRPIRKIKEAAEAVARGRGDKSLGLKGFAPSEVHALSAALETMTGQLSDRAEYIADFATNVSHELKSPITAIRGAAELLQEGADDMPIEQRTRFLKNVDADAARMERLVTRLLELARIQSAPESAEEVQVKDFFHRIAGSYGEVVVLDTRHAPTTITINSDHLESAVRNLLDNAVRHGEGEPVDVTVREERDRMTIEVRDRGPGISPANRKRIFDRFFTTTRDLGGTGIGLSVVQAVADTRGGEVRLETGEYGSTFILVI